MSFSFNFASNELNEEDGGDKTELKGEDILNDGAENGTSSKDGFNAKQHSIESLLTNLPSKLSFTRIKVPIPHSDRSFYVYRRDLFDARFQMLHEDSDEEEEGKEDSSSNQDWRNVMAGAATDLIPGVYEGGLKTWECSLDLAGFLAHKVSESPDFVKGKKVIELGCGTAIPSCYLFSNAFTQRNFGGEKINLTLQLCDFNQQVLRMVTLPNLFLNWYFSHHNPQSVSERDDQGEVELEDDITDVFLDSLKSFGVNVEFYSGHWQGLNAIGALNDQSLPDIILTSETIYSMDTLPILVDTLEDACNGSLEHRLQQNVSLQSGEKMTLNNADEEKLCLVAAKVMYFGVGGGVYAFEQELECRKASAAWVWKSEKGVSRVILQIHWKGK